MDLPVYHPFRSVEAKETYLAAYAEWEKRWPGPSETNIIKTSFGETLVRVNGPAGAPPLVLLPGACVTSLMWLPNIEGLVENFRTYAVDYDYGRSVFRQPVQRVGDLAEWFRQLLEGLGLGYDINLLGISLGGWQAAQLAMVLPERLRGVVLVSPAATVLPLSAAFTMRFLLSLIPVRPFSSNLIRWMFRDYIRSGETGRKMTEAAWAEMQLAIRSFSFEPKRYQKLTVLSDEEWRRIEVPTLFLVGANEKLYHAHQAVKKINEVAPHIVTAIIPGAGHDLPTVKTEEFNQKVKEFLMKLRDGGQL
jgi:pimeloyl-ACP methyl ester carboxylesterase